MSFTEAIAAAVRLLSAWDPQVVSAAAVSLRVSLLATLLATLLGVPVGFWVAARDFHGRRVVALVLKTLTAFPTVVFSSAARRLSSSWVETSIRTLVLCMQISIHTRRVGSSIVDAGLAPADPGGPWPRIRLVGATSRGDRAREPRRRIGSARPG